MGVSGSKTGREVVPHLGAAQLSAVHVAFFLFIQEHQCKILAQNLKILSCQFRAS